ncbi:LysR family transcriptional regulator [Clostridium fungisolvens]|uniref:HTH-type transcriptional regulator GltC n=1 Tax=Clostridium fungisolvens TaxID=1604897 RepID=A0A6V8SED9_9CLOT|nr:LysR family transcriptional regulator [Clostridium fungisolvens]GFP74835.1 HTH-type transcriptional regulator GltC [Clostridium fungisolvens]
MNLKQLEYFRVLAGMEHVTLAAEKLSITQPNLTYAISELEKELGVFLFEKQGRNIKLTKYGRFFLNYVTNSLNELEKGEKELKRLVNPTHGTIDLAFIYTLGPHFVPNMIKTFFSEEANKNISFNFSQGNTKNIIQGLKEEKFDLAFCSYVENEPNINFIPVTEQELVLIVSKDHPLAAFDTIDLKETEPYPFVYYNKLSGLRPIIDDLFAKVDFSPKIICEVEEDSAAGGLVSINYGIAVVPNAWVIKQFDVKTLKIVNPPHKRFIYLAYMKNKYLSPTVHLFKDFVLNGREDHFKNSENSDLLI